MTQHRLRPLARHRPLRAAVRPPGADAEHPAAGRSGAAVPPRVLRRAHLLGLPRLPADRPVGALERDDRARPPRLRARTTTATTSSTRCATPATGPGWSASSTSRATPTCSATTTWSTSTTTTSTRSRRPRCALIAERPSDPFFLSIGFFETHREYFEPTSVRDSLYSLPPANLPDTRRDAPRHGLLQGERALARPRRRRGAQRARRARPRRRHDRDPHHRPRARVPGREGDADRPRARRDADRARPRRLPRRQGLRGARLPDRPLPDAVRARRDRARRTGCRAARCCRSCGARPTRSTTPSSPSSPSTPPTSPSAPSAPSATSTSAASASARTPVLPERRRRADQGPAASRHGWGERELPREELHDLVFDPAEAANVADDPAYAEVRAELAERLERLDARDRRSAAARRRRAAARRRGHRPRRDLPRRHADRASIVAGRNPAAC